MGLDIVVCIKSVILAAPEEQVLRTEDTSELNPFDRPVLEAALRLKEFHGGRVTAISMGPETSLSALSEARAMGVDREILICDPALAGSDTLATSTALGAGLQKLVPFDLVLFGVRTADSDTGQVGPQTSVQLGIPFISMVFIMKWQKDVFRVERVADHFLKNMKSQRLRHLRSIPVLLSLGTWGFQGLAGHLSQSGSNAGAWRIWGLCRNGWVMRVPPPGCFP